MTKVKIIFMALVIPALLGFYSGENKENQKVSMNKPADSPVALVKKIVKDVTYKKTSEQSDWEIAKTGIPLNDGGEVKTGDKSLALILFTDGSGLLRVRENSILNIYGEKSAKKMNKNTFIQKGLIGFDVNKQGEDEEFKFTTPTVVASIRGTDGFLEFSDDSTFTMSLDNGSASLNFTGQGGGEGSLNGGNTVIITSNGEFQYREQSDDDKNKSDNTKYGTKKINIRTPQGDVGIEFYGPQN